jgi:hypothetical protein
MVSFRSNRGRLTASWTWKKPGEWFETNEPVGEIATRLQVPGEPIEVEEGGAAIIQQERRLLAARLPQSKDSNSLYPPAFPCPCGCLSNVAPSKESTPGSTRFTGQVWARPGNCPAGLLAAYCSPLIRAHRAR